MKFTKLLSGAPATLMLAASVPFAGISSAADAGKLPFSDVKEGEKLGAYVTTVWRVEHGYDPS